MHTLFARALVVLVLAPALLGQERLLGERGARRESSRPLEDMRYVVGLVTFADRIDVYWLHTDERAATVRSTLYRTSLKADGSTRLTTTRIHAFDDNVSASVSGAGGNVQALWNAGSGIMVSPIQGDALKYPQGKLVAFGNYAGIQCHATECVAVYDVSNMQLAAILNSDGSVTSGPFPLPSGFHPLRIEFDERGIFFVRHNLTQLRAALVRRDGSVQYDLRLASADPRAFHTTHPGVTTKGSDYVVAFVEFGTAPDELHAVTVAGDGSVSAPKRLMQVEEHRDLPNNFAGASLAFNGSRFLLGGFYVIGRPFLMSLDASLQQTGSLFRRDAIPSVHRHPDGTSFILLWHAPSPYVTILRADGSMSAPISMVPPKPRRRAVR
ncbi:MAG TPA: hypothetical protein VE974_29630 [Thermoanaerobaculia bacterium]|nr:hypothetical protein [Thermoanaerobaculia bacterium]